MTFLEALSLPGYHVFEVDEGVMMMYDVKASDIYYFPASEQINPEQIKQRPLLVDELKEEEINYYL